MSDSPHDSACSESGQQIRKPVCLSVNQFVKAKKKYQSGNSCWCCLKSPRFVRGLREEVQASSAKASKEPSYERPRSVLDSGNAEEK